MNVYARIQKLSAAHGADYTKLMRIALHVCPQQFGITLDEFDGTLPEHSYAAFDDSGTMIAVLAVRQSQLKKLAHKKHLYGAYVVEEWRNSNVMTQLASYIVAQDPQAVYFASTIEENLSPQRVLEKVGFKHIWTEEDAMRDGETSYALKHYRRLPE